VDHRINTETGKQAWVVPRLEKIAMVDTRNLCMPDGNTTGSKKNAGIEMDSTCSVGS
jgi:hypothetical protein